MSAHELRRVGVYALAVLGWAAVAVADLLTVLPVRYALGLSLLGLGVALTSTTWLLTTRYQRPLGEAYELGYLTGRRDAIREANGSGRRLSSLEDRLSS